MTKKRSASTPTTLIGVAILVVVVIAGLFYGWDRVLPIAKQLGVDTSAIDKVVTQIAPATSEVAATSEVTATNEATATQAVSDQSTPSATSTDDGSQAVGGGGGEPYEVYFTDPASFPKGTISGGIEMNLIDLIDQARSTIDLAVFEFDLQDVADALIAAHNRGVQVRIVYDDEHTAPDPQMDQMIAAGIPATPDKRSAFMHNKFFVIDGFVVWMGSTNMTVNDMFKNNNNSVVFNSRQLAENYTAEFEEMFNGQFGPTSPSNTPNPEFKLNGILIQNYFGSEDQTLQHLVEMIQSAKKSIHFMAFSFTKTDPDLGKAMAERGAAGVEVSGIFEQRGADTSTSECSFLRQKGFDVRLDGNPQTFHDKVIIVDGETVEFGSFNFSSNAANGNDENYVIVHDPWLAAQYEEEFQRRMAEAQMPPGTACKMK
jgi:phosphatidylserine/phosphatidylglycerophosphate/cardiolipin synthase-like enzyme